MLHDIIACRTHLFSVDVAPFRSEKDSYSFFRTWRADPESKLRAMQIYFIAQKIIGVCWV